MKKEIMKIIMIMKMKKMNENNEMKMKWWRQEKMMTKEIIVMIMK